MMLHYSVLDVKNLFEAPVTADQFESRAIMKGSEHSTKFCDIFYNCFISQGLLLPPVELKAFTEAM